MDITKSRTLLPFVFSQYSQCSQWLSGENQIIPRIRKRWDSNPRYVFSVHTLSKRAP